MRLLAVLLLGFQFAAPVKIADGFDPATAGLAWLGAGQELLAWDTQGVRVFRYDAFSQEKLKPIDCGLSGVRDIVSISPGDFNGDGLDDLAILTKFDAELWVNRHGRFERLNIFVPEGAYNKAVWVDYDHDGALDLFLLGDKSVLLRNDGAGFTNVTNNFPFVQGRAWDGAMHDGNLLVLYSDRPGVRYIDKGHGLYVAEEANTIPAGTPPIRTGAALDVSYAGSADRFEIRPGGSLVFLRGVTGYK